MKSLLLAFLGFFASVAPLGHTMEVNDSARLLSASPVPTIIGIGESAHDDPASLAWRNALVLALVERDAVRLVLLETGYAESRLLDAYVRGDGPLTSETLDRGFANGLGMFAENRALIEAIRTINQGRPPQEQVSVVGIDLGAGGPWGSAPSLAPVECALEAVPVEERDALRQAFEQSVKPGLEGASVTHAQVRTYRRLVTRLQAALPASAGFEQNLCLRIVNQGANLLATLPPGLPKPDLPRAAWRNIEARDQAMADNAILLASHFSGRPALLLSHLSHIAKTPMRGPRWAQLARPPRSMGQFLSAKLGRGYRTIIGVAMPTNSICFAGMNTSVLMAASMPQRTCAITINRSETQIIDLRRSSDMIQFVAADP